MPTAEPTTLKREHDCGTVNCFTPDDAPLLDDCPFCGEVAQYTHTGVVKAECTGCGAETLSCASFEDDHPECNGQYRLDCYVAAAEHWNQRVDWSAAEPLNQRADDLEDDRAQRYTVGIERDEDPSIVVGLAEAQRAQTRLQRLTPSEQVHIREAAEGCGKPGCGVDHKHLPVEP